MTFRTPSCRYTKNKVNVLIFNVRRLRKHLWDNDRYTKWIYASHAVGGVEQYKAFMAVAIQGLARLDCQLIAADEQFLRLTEQQRATIPVSVELSERVTLSYLWVLGAYELLRTLDERTKKASSGAPSPMAARITETKHLFERVRIPLAKLEASRRNPDDNLIAYPAISAIHGIAWHIADNTFVSRRKLADEFLLLMTELRSERE